MSKPLSPLLNNGPEAAAYHAAIAERAARREQVRALVAALIRCERAVGFLNPNIQELGAGKLAELNASAEAARAVLKAVQS